MTESVSNSAEDNGDTRFTSQASTAEDVLKEQTFGLVQLSDFRKRRAQALEQDNNVNSESNGRELTTRPVFAKKKKKTAKAVLSFDDDEDEAQNDIAPSAAASASEISRDTTPGQKDQDGPAPLKRKLKPSASVAQAPKSQSKAALARETQMKEALKKEYLQMQEAVRATDFMLPFVFFDGKDTVGGKVRMKKGDHIWLFLERARKVGAESASKTTGTRKDWARISTDDLMLVKQDLILPPHFDFHFFIQNKSTGYHGTLFDFSSEPTSATPPELFGPDADNATDKDNAPTNATESGVMHPKTPRVPDERLEGFDDEPSLTRVVDRRWFEKSKHIYPANLWEDYDAQRDYSKGGRKDRQGNQMFFSR